MSQLETSRTLDNLKKAFTFEATLFFRYLYFSKIADFEGKNNLSDLFKEFAEGGECNVHGSLDFLRFVADPDSGIPLGESFRNLESIIISETKGFNNTYKEMANTARKEGFTDIASWFDTLLKLKRSHVKKLRELENNE